MRSKSSGGARPAAGAPGVSAAPGRPKQARTPSGGSEPRKAGRGGAGVIRIIGGLWKRSKLTVAALPGLRPTPDRVRETLFNWLGQDLTGLRCLDAFAGSGALGFEAASRGAAEVLLIEQAPALVAALKDNATRLKATQITVQRGDALSLMRQRAGQVWDVVFLDPPFGDGQNEAVFRDALKAARDLVSANGSLYLEAPRVWTDAELTELGWRVLRQGRAGQVAFHLLGPQAAGG
ncbi:MAG: 16S rRNA (guanine(966)-N(2))-methyltransferase RsmD [Hydrogenophaga sp.]|nr:16S rRNA (guanine(966)-N(2))-methyltransferase RsmD [Hydrogenophaga sp.]